MSNSNSAAKMAMARGSNEIKQDDKVEELKNLARKARDINEEIIDLESRLKEHKVALYNLYTSTMPDLMAQLGFDRIGVQADGNHQAMDFKLLKQITANIAAGWDEPRKEQGFAVLKNYRAEDLIKTEVQATFPKGELKAAKQLIAAAKKLGIKADLKKSVPHMTLGSWLREFYASGRSLSSKELEALGAFVGFIVKPSERKE